MHLHSRTTSHRDPGVSHTHCSRLLSSRKAKLCVSSTHTLSWPTPSNASGFGKEGRSVASRRTQTIWENVWKTDANDEEKVEEFVFRFVILALEASEAQRNVCFAHEQLVHGGDGDSPWLTKSEIAPRGALDHHRRQLVPRYPPRRHVHRRQRGEKGSVLARSAVSSATRDRTQRNRHVLDEMMPEENDKNNYYM